MNRFVLTKWDACKLPLTKREVKKGVPVNVGDKEAEMLRRYGHYVELDEEEEDEFDGLFGKAPSSFMEVPKEWTGCTILLICFGGIGDCLIASSIASSLKKKVCHVTFAVGKNAIKFCEQLMAPDEVVEIAKTNSTNYTNKFDIVLKCTGYPLAGPKMIIDMDFYEACFNKVAWYNQPIVMPRFNLNRMSDKTKGRLMMSGTDSNSRVAVHVDPTAIHRKWPFHYWSDLFRKLETQGISIMLLGLQNDSFKDNPNVVNCTDMGVEDQLQICNSSRFFLGIDSCWAHIAGLMNMRGLVLFAPSVPENLIGRYSNLQAVQPYDQVCPHRNFHSHQQGKDICNCIEELKPDIIYSKIREHLYTKMEDIDFKQNQIKEYPEEVIKRQLKVTFVFPHVMLGGGEVSSLELCKHLQNYFDFDIVALTSFQPPRNIVKELTELKAHFAKTESEIARYIKDTDVVLWYGMNTTMVSALRNLKRRPYSIRVCHTHFKEEAEGFVESYESYIDKSICVSPVKAREMGAKAIPNPVDTKRLKDVVRGKEKRKVMGFIGRLDQNKNIKWLLRNVSASGYHLIVQGIDEAYTVEELKWECQKLGIDDQVSFYSGDITKFYEDIDVIILPSKMEALPMVVLEAGYLGIPSIMTNVGGMKDLLGDLVRTIDIEDGIPSLFDLREALQDYHNIDTEKLKKFILENCTGETVAKKFREFIRSSYGEQFPNAFQSKTFKFFRGEGIGDVIMSSAMIQRVAETLPNSKIEFHTNEKCEDFMRSTFLHLTNVTVFGGGQIPSVEHIEYNRSWEKEIHAVKGMGGQIEEVIGNVNRKPKGYRKTPRIGIMPYMNKGAKKKIKEWPSTKWKKLVSDLRKEGYSIYQLGHKSDNMIAKVKDGRGEDLQEIVDIFDTMDFIIAIEGLACHIGKVLDKPILVIQGNSSRHWHTSYTIHDHVFSNSKCKCLASISDDFKKPCKIECMTSISPKRVLTEFHKHVWKLSKQELS